MPPMAVVGRPWTPSVDSPTDAAAPPLDLSADGGEAHLLPGRIDGVEQALAVLTERVDVIQSAVEVEEGSSRANETQEGDDKKQEKEPEAAPDDKKDKAEAQAKQEREARSSQVAGHVKRVATVESELSAQAAQLASLRAAVTAPAAQVAEESPAGPQLAAAIERLSVEMAELRALVLAGAPPGVSFLPPFGRRT